MATTVIDTPVDPLKIWQGTEEQIQAKIQSGDITDTDIAIATDVDYVQPNEIGDGTLTIQKNGQTVATFSANDNNDATANITITDPVNADWNQDNPNSLDFIKNKPTITSITVKRIQ